MRKLIFLGFITVDGVSQAPGGPGEASGGFPYGGWQARYLDEFLDKILDEELREPFDLLLALSSEGGKGDRASTTRPSMSPRRFSRMTGKTSVFWKDDAAAQVRKLKQQDGRVIIMVGSANLIHRLLGHDLIDEFWLKIGPITLGKAKRLFAPMGSAPQPYDQRSRRHGTGTFPAAFKVSFHQRV